MAKTYTPEQKAQVIAAYALGSSKAAISREMGIPRTTVKAILDTNEVPKPTVSDPFQQERLGQLVYEYLASGFEALIAQNKAVANAALVEGGENKPAFTDVYRSIHSGVVTIAAALERGRVALDDGGDDAGQSDEAGS